MVRRVTLLAAAWCALQLAAPLHYYLIRSDPADERFSWRMFSPVHMMRCDLRLRTAGSAEPIDLESRFHPGWIELGQRGRRSVIEAMARRLCAEAPPVGLELSCRTVDGAESRAAVADFCSEGPPWQQHG